MKLKIKKSRKTKKQESIKKFDVVIIGGGQTGLVLARQLIKNEISTLIIDRNYLGIKNSLDLKNFSKIAKRALAKNINPKDIISTLSQRLKFINDEQNKELTSTLLNNSFFEFIKGEPDFIDEYSLKINNQEIGFKKLVFATGSYYEEPTNFPNLQKHMYFNLDEINKIDSLYQNIAIYGTNPQAIELAYSFALLGTNVYIFDENVNPFNNFDDDFESILKTEFMIEKVNWCLESKIINHYNASDRTTRINFTSQGQNKFIEVDKIFITDNKRSETRKIKTKYKLELNNKGSIIIDNYFRVKNNPTYYAIGDVNGIKMLSSYANNQAMTLSRIFSSKKTEKFNLFSSSFIIDIEPQICFYGMSKNELEYLNIKYNEFTYDFNYELNSKLYSHKSKLKVFTNERHEILGIFLYGHKIKELLSIFILAANNKIKFHKLANINFPFYSKSEFIRDAAVDYELEFVGLLKKRKKGKIKMEKNKKGDK